MACVMSIYFKTGNSKRINDLADIVKVLPESYQKSNEFSVNRQCGQNVAIPTNDRRIFTDKGKVRRIQTLENNNKGAMLECESGFHQSEDKRKLRSINVKSILITNWVHYLLLFFCLFVCFISFVAFMRNFVSNTMVADECHHVVLDKAVLCMNTLCIQQKCDESALRAQQIDVAKEIKFRSRYMMFVYHCNINNPEYHVRRGFGREPSRIPVKKTRKAFIRR